MKAPVALATTGPITLSGEQTIDGVLTSGTDVLVKDQTNTVENGIYVSDSSAWSRRVDFDDNRDVVDGSTVLVTSGSTNLNTYWRVSAVDPVILGTTPIAINQSLTSDSASMSFLQAGAGAIPRAAQAKMRERFDARDFGAVAGAENSAAIALAIAAITSGVGTRLFIPQSKLAKTIILNKANVVVNCEMQTMSFDAAYAKVLGDDWSGNNVMFAVNVPDVIIQNTAFDSSAYAHAGSHIWIAAPGDYSEVKSCKFTGLYYDGVNNSVAIQTRSGSDGVKIHDNTFHDCCGSVSMQGSNGVTRDNVTYITAAQPTAVAGTTDQAYGLDGSTGCSLINNKVIRSVGAPSSGANIGANTGTINFNISDNYIYGLSGGVGIYVSDLTTPADNSNYGVVKGNTVDGGSFSAGGPWRMMRISGGSVTVSENVFKGTPITNLGRALEIVAGNNICRGNIFALGASGTAYSAIDVTETPSGNAGSLLVEGNSISCGGRGISLSITNNQMVPITIRNNKYLSPTAVAITAESGYLPNAPVYMDGDYFDPSTGAQPVTIPKYILPFTYGTGNMPYRITRQSNIWGAAAPTNASYYAGTTWEIGDEVHNSVPAAGQPSGWICTKTGTFGAFTEAGTTTSGSPIVTGMADTTDIFVGDFVDASAGFAVLTILRVIGKTANSLTLDRNANASGAATLSTTDPVFTAMANL